MKDMVLVGSRKSSRRHSTGGGSHVKQSGTSNRKINEYEISSKMERKIKYEKSHSEKSFRNPVCSRLSYRLQLRYGLQNLIVQGRHTETKEYDESLATQVNLNDYKDAFADPVDSGFDHDDTQKSLLQAEESTSSSTFLTETSVGPVERVETGSLFVG